MYYLQVDGNSEAGAPIGSCLLGMKSRKCPTDLHFLSLITPPKFSKTHRTFWTLACLNICTA